MEASDAGVDPLEQGFSLGRFEVHPTLNRVTGPTGTVRLEPRIMAVFLTLARQAGAVVPRDEIFREVWGSSGATDDVLSRSISEIRKALGESSRTATLVETIPKSGYRLTVLPQPLPAAHALVEPQAPESPNGTEAESAPRPPRRFRMFGTMAAGLAAAAIGLVALQSEGSGEPPGLGVRFDQVAQPFSTRDGDEIHPAVSPDGSRVVYGWRAKGGTFDLVSAQTEGAQASDVLPVTQTDWAHEVSPTWSPDGQYLAFIRISSTPCEIVVMNVETTTESVLHTCTEESFDRLRWSPSGTFLALRGRAGSSEPNSLFRFDLDASDPSRTPPRGPESITSPPPQSPGDDAFVIGPDGNNIVLTRLEVESVADLYHLDLRTGALTRLTENRGAVYDLLWPESNWVWASTGWKSERGVWRIPVQGGDAELVAETETEMYDLAGGPGFGALVFRQLQSDVDLVRIDLADPVARTTLSGSTRADSKPAVSPDQQFIAFESNRSGPYEVWVAQIDGSAPRQITQLGGAYNGYPRWSPDGTRLAFEGRPGGQADIYVADVEGEEARAITSHTTQDVMPSWSHDGEALYWASDRTGRWEIWRRQLGASEDHQVTMTGGLAPQASKDGQYLYYAKPYDPGIWRIDLSDDATTGEEQIVSDLVVGDYSAWVLADVGLLYQRRDPDGRAQLVQFDPAKGQSTDLFSMDPTPLYYGGIALSPDGRFAIVATQSRLENDLALLETAP